MSRNYFFTVVDLPGCFCQKEKRKYFFFLSQFLMFFSFDSHGRQADFWGAGTENTPITFNIFVNYSLDCLVTQWISSPWSGYFSNIYMSSFETFAKITFPKMPSKQILNFRGRFLEGSYSRGGRKNGALFSLGQLLKTNTNLSESLNVSEPEWRALETWKIRGNAGEKL